MALSARARAVRSAPCSLELQLHHPPTFCVFLRKHLAQAAAISLLCMSLDLLCAASV